MNQRSLLWHLLLPSREAFKGNDSVSNRQARIRQISMQFRS